MQGEFIVQGGMIPSTYHDISHNTPVERDSTTIQHIVNSPKMPTLMTMLEGFNNPTQSSNFINDNTHSKLKPFRGHIDSILGVVQTPTPVQDSMSLILLSSAVTKNDGTLLKQYSSNLETERNNFESDSARVTFSQLSKDKEIIESESKESSSVVEPLPEI